jgi:NAD/NADP transhydrogenase alpha subunit
MNWDAISSVAEIIGAIAVVVSLIYLASQVKQSNTQARGEAHSNWLTTWSETIKG